MATDRIKVNFTDLSQSVSVSSASLGFFSLASAKGADIPVLFDVGSTQKILDTYGYPSSTYPQVQDLIDFNLKSAVYAVAPVSASNATYGGVLVTKTGTTALSAGLASKTIDFSNLDGSDHTTDTYFVILDKYPQEDDRQVLVTSLGGGQFNIQAFQKDKNGDYQEMFNSPYVISLVEGDKDGFGNNIYYENVMENDLYFEIVPNTALTFDTFTDDTSAVALVGGDRGDALTGSDIAGGYAFAEDRRVYPANVFFDGSAEDAVATKFESLRTTYNTRARYLLPVVNQAISTTLADTAGAKNSIANRGIVYYAGNWGIHTDVYNNQDFLCSNMGLIAGKHADIINLGFGGFPPAWIDENGMGGILGSSIKSLSYNPKDAELTQLRNAQINGVFMHPLYGAMIEDSKTTQSFESDYSYIEHSGLADFLVSTIEEQVLPYQIKKLNDTRHRTIARSKTESILGAVGNLLNAFAVKCDSENNNADVLNRKEFVLTVGVQFTPFSNWVIFNFVNTPQGVSVEETIQKSV